MISVRESVLSFIRLFESGYEPQDPVLQAARAWGSPSNDAPTDYDMVLADTGTPYGGWILPNGVWYEVDDQEHTLVVKQEWDTIKQEHPQIEKAFHDDPDKRIFLHYDYFYIEMAIQVGWSHVRFLSEYADVLTLNDNMTPAQVQTAKDLRRNYNLPIRRRASYAPTFPVDKMLRGS